MKKVKYYYHTTTKNASFLQVYEHLKKSGVKNNAFFLRLYDKELADIEDIYNPPVEMKARILMEVKKNFWYFIREVLRIPVSGGEKPYELHRGNLALSWCLLKNLNTILIVPRQNYKTVSACAFYLWLFLFRTKNSDIAFLNKSKGDSVDNLKRVKDMRETLPDYLKMTHRDDVDNKTLLTHHLTKNRIVPKPSATSEDAAINIGRGSTQACQWYDEFCFIKWLAEIYGSASPASSQAFEEAKRFRKPHHKLITTTTGDLRKTHGLYSKNFIDNAAIFDEKMYDWTPDEIEKYIQTNSTNNFVYIFYTYQQLGRSEEWFINQCREMNMDKGRINREILLYWASASDNSPFSEEAILRLKNYITKPIQTIMVRSYLFWVYKNFDFMKPVFIGVDPAEGLSQERTAITIADASNLEVIAHFHNSKIDNPETANLILTLATDIFPNAIVVVENNKGKAILDLLKKSSIKGKLYFELKEKKVEFKVDSAGKKRRQMTKINVYGVNTGIESRPQMIDIIPHLIQNDPHLLHSEYIIDDIAGLERSKTGRIEHSSVSFDDSLFSYLLIRWVWIYGKNLGKFNIVRCMDKDSTDKHVMDPAEVKRKMNFVNIMNRKDMQMSNAFKNNYGINALNNQNIYGQMVNPGQSQLRGNIGGLNFQPGLAPANQVISEYLISEFDRKIYQDSDPLNPQAPFMQKIYDLNRLGSDILKLPPAYFGYGDEIRDPV